MKRTVLSAVLITFVLSLAGIAWAQEDVKKAPTCTYCGMNRTKFAHTRMLVTYDDGTKVGTCSLHCLSLELAINIDKTPQIIEVGDAINKKLINAETAYWVIGGNKPGVMTKQGKWAFANKVYAEKFVREHGGTLTTFEEAMKAAYVSMYTDTKMMREKKATMKMDGVGPK
jgi:copper chaperone NosL